jgi:alkanesulfonate monooxygenase SsuD/methylene tetrahydromethanopterin reductase-like flavin-dependent oxidoreductase (luciferase family)
MIPLSVLDLSPVVAGGTAADSLRNTLDLARHAERWGYRRYWLAEHHNMPGIASAATAIVIGHVAAATRTMRIGSGGIMLPNHAPLVIAEQFGTLESLFPGRIDLGLGRAPGTDMVTAHALRRDLAAGADRFPQDVAELRAYLGPAAPAQMMQAIALYRAKFRPSAQLDQPYVMLGFNVFAADTDERAQVLATSMQQSFVNLRSGRPGRLPPPLPGYREKAGPGERALLDSVLSCAAIGSHGTVRDGLKAFIEKTGADELMIACAMFDHQARLRSYEIASEVREQLA